MKNDRSPGPSKEECVSREPAGVEMAMERLVDMLNGNRALSEQIHNKVFCPRPVVNGSNQENPNRGTLASIIHELTEYVSTTNDILVDVYDCLSRQLGDIRLD